MLGGFDWNLHKKPTVGISTSSTPPVARSRANLANSTKFWKDCARCFCQLFYFQIATCNPDFRDTWIVQFWKLVEAILDEFQIGFELKFTFEVRLLQSVSSSLWKFNRKPKQEHRRREGKKAAEDALSEFRVNIRLSFHLFCISVNMRSRFTERKVLRKLKSAQQHSKISLSTTAFCNETFQIKFTLGRQETGAQKTIAELQSKIAIRFGKLAQAVLKIWKLAQRHKLAQEVLKDQIGTRTSVYE